MGAVFSNIRGKDTSGRSLSSTSTTGSRSASEGEELWRSATVVGGGHDHRSGAGAEYHPGESQHASTRSSPRPSPSTSTATAWTRSSSRRPSSRKGCSPWSSRARPGSACSPSTRVRGRRSRRSAPSSTDDDDAAHPDRRRGAVQEPSRAILKSAGETQIIMTVPAGVAAVTPAAVRRTSFPRRPSARPSRAIGRSPVSSTRRAAPVDVAIKAVRGVRDILPAEAGRGGSGWRRRPGASSRPTATARSGCPSSSGRSCSRGGSARTPTSSRRRCTPSRTAAAIR